VAHDYSINAGGMLMMLFLLLVELSFAQCNWGEQKIFGEFSGSILPEASGMIANGKSLFFINDGEGDGAIYRFTQGSEVERIRLDISPLNLEAISAGSCGKGQCFYLADTGDNKLNRESVEIYEVNAVSFKVNRSWKMNYQDGPKNVEAFIVGKNGDFFFLSKSGKKKKKGENGKSKANLYHIGAHELEKTNVEASLIGEVSGISAPITDMALSQSGDRVAILTTDTAFELPFSSFVKGDFSSLSEVGIEKLPKQESISYLSDGKLLWSSEAEDAERVPILSLECK
jgi:hypothetical protein